MAKLKRKTIYTISIKGGWFKGKTAMLNGDPELDPPYSSARVLRTASKFDRVAHSLINAGFELEHTDRRFCWYRAGRLIRVKYDLINAHSPQFDIKHRRLNRE